MTAGSAARLAAALSLGALLAGCGAPDRPVTPPSSPAAPGDGFESADCNGVTDADVARAAGPGMFAPAVVSDVGCFWQEDTMIEDVGAGMGITTWWYRGSDMDTERDLEQLAGRTLTEWSIDDNEGFKAFDDSACSIYVAKGGDVITWSIQTMNSATMPDLCPVVEQLAQLSQQRVN
ncbi:MULTISPECIES: DUF3558 domain-containing protein [Mycolicibacterium]|uniref:LprB protein n=3 Tax=Mycolicibacterium gilvum TaxID=1804 RepID=E6TF07_MYCSR|nr:MULTISPECIES: DUF3558 domain-containing protein [Mycolicibacterium]ABP47546.1 conserved hypothetical protein [Mycolicibacterium gilvum PYR-GCK]ADU01053.1 hypothetical protein Mspyr1_44980 [Mycolicibacterium gilvum Spyr1]MBV5242606.1 DUF3558 domain-containing protein [Mycolicibacterium sp. PAM1]MCV7058706.1 DUF3558 domain-containing protein [Mycolicibacterium gilvum]STZ41926.1 Protein of uncharacterised function (DUF3558) [Mycolicibacterium gilvum]